MAAYAPTTATELTRWWLGPPAPQRGAQLLTALGDEAAELMVEGERAWALTGDLPHLAASEPRELVRLLPAFDPWVIGAARQAPLLERRYLARVYRPQGWISPVLLVNGRIAGTWTHTCGRQRVRVELAPFHRLPPWAHGQAEAEAERLAALFGWPLELQWSR